MKPHIRQMADVAMPTITAEAHTGASLSARDMVAWKPQRGSADADLLPELDSLVGRSRDIERNNGIAKGGIQTIVDNVVGVGLRLSCRPNYRSLGRTKEWADEWSAQVEAMWWGWAETTACDAADTLIFDQMTALMLKAQLTNGEALVLPLWVPDRGDGWATKLQTVEADRLSNPHYKVDTVSLRGGIEFDRYGAPIAYNIRSTHPGDFWLGFPGGFSMGTWERVPRRTPFGRTRVIHLYDKDRSGQSRGKPLLSSVLSLFKQADRYTRAEIDAAVANGMIAGLIETPLDQDAIISLFSNDSEKYLQNRRDHAVALESGSLLPVFPGDKVQPFIPGRPSSSFGPFMENIFRIIAVACDMPYELLLKDFSKTTYSSARASMLEAWRSFLRRRDWLSTQWCDPVYNLWLEEAVGAGKVDAPDFYERRAEYLRCKWIGPGRGWVDPVKESQAADLRVKGHFSTLEFECAQQGLDWEEVLEQQALERERMKELGLDGNEPEPPELDETDDEPVPVPAPVPS